MKHFQVTKEIIVSEDGKEDFKKLMNWNEIDFANKTKPITLDKKDLSENVKLDQHCYQDGALDCYKGKCNNCSAKDFRYTYMEDDVNEKIMEFIEWEKHRTDNWKESVDKKAKELFGERLI